MTEEKKFVVGEEVLQPSPPPRTTVGNASGHSAKRHARQHVKRRSSSGRMHSAKLAPMARVSTHTDSETTNMDVDRPVMRRTQSQRSLHRLDKKKKIALSTIPSNSRESSTVISPPRTPPPITMTILPPTTCLTHINPAAPIEQTFHAIANNLIVPTQSAYPAMHEAAAASSPAKSERSRKQPLRSQFLSQEDSTFEPKSQHSRCINTIHTSQAPTQSAGMRLSQQHSACQHLQYREDDEECIHHPRNTFLFTCELDRIGREYHFVKRYQDPMRESLLRCMERRKGKQTFPSFRSTLPSALQAQDSPRHVLHMEQRQAAHRHHCLNAIASSHTHSSQTPLQVRQKASSSVTSSSSTSFGFAAILDRVFGGMRS